METVVPRAARLLRDTGHLRCLKTVRYRLGQEAFSGVCLGGCALLLLRSCGVHRVHIRGLLQKRSKKANLGAANNMYYSEKARPHVLCDLACPG
jgi:hypothetical protein